MEDAVSEISAKRDALYCSFCGKSQHEVRKLIAGPTVFICNECIELCSDIVKAVIEGPNMLSAQDLLAKCPPGEMPAHVWLHRLEEGMHEWYDPKEVKRRRQETRIRELEEEILSERSVLEQKLAPKQARLGELRAELEALGQASTGKLAMLNPPGLDPTTPTGTL